MEREVVITGYGIVSSIGNNCDEVLQSLKNNKSGVVAVPEWAELGFKSCVARTIKGLDMGEIRQKIGPKSRYMDCQPSTLLLQPWRLSSRAAGGANSGRPMGSLR